MNLRQVLEKIVQVVPTVKKPIDHISFKEKIFWTLAMLIMYFVMTNVPILGLGQGGSDALGQFRGILAGSQGTIFQLGIMPIVTASIVLQIITGTGLMPLDLNDPRDQKFYQGIRRSLIVIMVTINGIPLIYGGGYLPASGAVANSLGIPISALKFFMLLQIVVGGILIFYMDEVVSKWGIGSGLGLFIIAGISQRFVGGIVTQVIPGWWSIITGQVEIGFSLSSAQLLLINPGYIVPIITTAGIFAIVVAAESTKVQIPTQRSRTGQRSTYDVKLIYASVLPIILVRAIQANVQFIGQGLDSALGARMPAWLGQYSGGQVTGGLFYYLTPIFRPQDWMWFIGTTGSAEPYMILIRVLVDFTFMTVGGAVFAVFWVRTTNKDAEAIAKQLEVQNMEIPGFRDNSQIMEGVLKRYIPYVTIIGGALIGALGVLASMLGTIGMVSGTGLLLAVSITVKLYDEIKEELVKSQLGSKYGFGDK